MARCRHVFVSKSGRFLNLIWSFRRRRKDFSFINLISHHYVHILNCSCRRVLGNLDDLRVVYKGGLVLADGGGGGKDRVDEFGFLDISLLIHIKL